MCYQKGKQCLDLGNLAQAEALFQKGLAEGDEKCTYGLLAVKAMAGQPRDEAIAKLTEVLPTLTEKANRGDGDACFIIGRCYETGSALTQDISQAILYYGKAANFGNADAMFNLGCIYMHMGQPAELLGVQWFSNAARLGHRDAQLALRYYQQNNP